MGSKLLALLVNIVAAGEMSRCKDMGDFDKNSIVVVIGPMIGLEHPWQMCAQSAVVSTNWSDVYS